MRQIVEVGSNSSRFVYSNSTRIRMFSEKSNNNSFAIGGKTLQRMINSTSGRLRTKVRDLAAFTYGILAADKAFSRIKTYNGWSRSLLVRVGVSDPDLWSSQSPALTQMLTFLTSDRWELEFYRAVYPKPRKRQKKYTKLPFKAVSLLSGGLDSLVGALDLAPESSVGLISSVDRGFKSAQLLFASSSGHKIRQFTRESLRPIPKGDTQERSRSLLFLLYAVVIADTSVGVSGQVELVVPENGFISANVPLTPLRLGSLSTRTTHPYVLSRYQKLLNELSLPVTIRNPYLFKTKGEMIKGCTRPSLLENLHHFSISCGKYRTHKSTHCGRCVPCQIRRASLKAAEIEDHTVYIFNDLSLSDSDHAFHTDVIAVRSALNFVESESLDEWIGGQLSYFSIEDRAEIHNMLNRGISELQSFHESF